jgi:GntR family transcriptional repressor for pyruvate dehydrogenase complex
LSHDLLAAGVRLAAEACRHTRRTAVAPVGAGKRTWDMEKMSWHKAEAQQALGFAALSQKLARRPTTYSAQIVAAVRDALFDDRLKPGDFLGTEKDLSQQFGVSRMAARDALRTLEATGVVDIKVGAGGGARISQGHPETFAEALSVQLKLAGVSVEEIIQVQAAIEVTAARLAAVNATPEDIAAMTAVLAQEETALDNLADFTEPAFGFHLAVADAAHNRVLKIQLVSLHYVVWPSRNPTLTTEVARRVHDLHVDIFEHIKAGDADAAAQAMSAHLTQVKSRRMKEHGEAENEIGCC